MNTVLAGQCRSCHRDLVQVITDGRVERTYHPFNYRERDDPCCPVLTISKGTEDWPEPRLSFEVPDDQFIPDVTQPKIEEKV